MTEETTTNLDVLSDETQEVDTQSSESESSDLFGESEGEPAEQPPEEFGDLEVEGQKFQLPKKALEKLNAERMMHADYTRKTQAAAQAVRMAQAREAELAFQREHMDKYLGEVATIAAIDRQLAEYQGINRQQLIDQDPVSALKLQEIVRGLEAQRAQAANSISQKQQHQAMQEQQITAALRHQAEAFFAREIPNWTQDRSDELMDYSVKSGIPAPAVTQFTLRNPAFAAILNKAELYDRLQAAKQPPGNPAPAAKPAAKVGQNANVRKDPASMTDAEFAAYRRRVQNRKK